MPVPMNNCRVSLKINFKTNWARNFKTKSKCLFLHYWHVFSPTFLEPFIGFIHQSDSEMHSTNHQCQKITAQVVCRKLLLFDLKCSDWNFVVSPKLLSIIGVVAMSTQ